MSIKIVTNGKIEVNNVKPILHFLTVPILTVMPEIPCLELYSWLQKKTGNENFPNVNLVLSICQLIV
jgi:hypothetical protein